MKAQMLKIAGVKSEAAFYKKFPTQEAFMKVHGKEFKKAKLGTEIDKAQAGATYPNLMNNSQPKPLNAPMIPEMTPAGLAPLAGAASIGNVPKFNIPASAGNQPAKGPGAGQIIGAASGLINAAGAFKQQKRKLQGLRQDTQLTELNRKAANSVDVDINSQREDSYVRPEDMITTGNQINPAGGVGGSVLSKNGKKISKKKFELGGEIQNTYAPDTLYDDLGYEPLEDSDQVKQYARGGYVPKMAAGGFTSFMGAGGTDFATKAVGSAFGNNAGSQMGAAVGNVAKMIPGVGPVVGAIAAPVLGAIGGVLDNAFGDAGKIKKQQSALDRENRGMQGEAMGRAIQGQNQSFMEDGGYVSNDWTPQLIAKFGDHSPEDVYDFAHEGMDSLRAGGHLRSYREPSERALQTYALGGELETHWGGEAENISENPYLPDGGETIMFRGQSHDESDGKGRTGIGITYGDNPVEVERGEPALKLRDGSSGDDNLVVYGNLQIPKYGVDLLEDKKAKGKKFKNYINDLSKVENRQNKIIESSSSEVDGLKVRNSFDKLKMSALEANLKGANMKLKNIADKKIKAADLQNAINDTASEYGLVADALAKGRAIQDKEAMKQQAKDGKLLKAQYGKGNLSKERLGRYDIDFESVNVPPNAIDLNEVVVTGRGKKKSKFPKPEIAEFEAPEFLENPYYQDKPEIGPVSQSVIDSYGRSVNSDSEKTSDVKLKPWQAMLFNEILNRTRPSDAEELDQNQLLGEMYAMATNQLEPVQAQKYNPQLQDPNSRISLQDQINDITAQTRASQRMSAYNPAAQAMIDAQAYQALGKVRGEEFRLNQDRFDKRSAENIATLNDAQLKNLGILDQQYQRQAEARSNTKATTQAALSSISDKYAKNQLSNRKLQAYENMYNYRYDDEGRLMNLNGLAMFNTQGNPTSKSSGKGLAPGYEFTYDSDQNIIGTRKSGKGDTAKNGSIVRSLKNI